MFFDDLKVTNLFNSKCTYVSQIKKKLKLNVKHGVKIMFPKEGTL